MIWLRALTQRWLNIRLAASRDTVVRIVERPGAWMSTDEARELVDDCREVARTSLAHGSLDYGIFGDEPEPLARTIITIIYDRSSGRPIAFNALPVLNVELGGEPIIVQHLGLVMVHPDARSGGLSWILYGLTCFLLFVRAQLRPLWISSVTQVPAVVGMVYETFSNVFPGPEAGGRSFEHLFLARQIMRAHRAAFGVGEDAGFDELRFVITNAYTGGSDNLKKSLESAQMHRDQRFNALCARELDYGRGDDLLQIGQLDLAAAQRYLLRVVPRRSLPGLLIQSALVLTQSIVLPIIHWFAADRPFGILRARS